MARLSGDRSDMVQALGWLCPQDLCGSMARGQWYQWLANHQRISKFHWPTQSYMTSQWIKPLECQYILSNGYTTVLLTHLTALPSTSVNCQLFNDGMYKAQARSGHFAKKRALAGCGELISTHGAHFLGGLTTVVDSGRAVNRLSERWMLKATSCGRNCHSTLHVTDDKSTLVQVMAWCRQATSHYLSQCWPSSLSPYGVTRPRWVKW